MGFDEWQQLQARIASPVSASLNLPHGMRAELREGRIEISKST
jgi:hypothetical protein